MTTSTLTTGLTQGELPLIDSERRPGGLQGLRGRILGRLALRAFGAIGPGESHSLPEPVVLSPYTDSSIYGISHYNVVIPDLPAPHHFLACATVLGASSLRVFDVDFAAQPKDGPRHTATVSHGTAVAVEGHFTRYSIPDDMTTHADGSLVRFGSALEISGVYPNFRMRSERPGFSVDIAMLATGDITWFAKSAVYNHLGLLTRYQGTLTHNGEVTPISGLCSLEYARGISPYLLVNRALPRRFKFPFDFFGYQVITLDANTQLLLVHCRVCDYSVMTLAYLTQAGQGGGSIDGTVHFRVLSTQAQPGVAPDGRETALPEKFSWDVRDKAGRSLFLINGTVDTPMLFGLGTGFVGGYRWEGTRDGKPTGGRGYIEYVDQRN